MVTVKVICLSGWKRRTRVFRDPEEANAYIEHMQGLEGYKCYKQTYVGW